MQFDINDYNQNQIQTALAADVQTAIGLWNDKDWHTYRSMRDVLLALIRSGRGDEVKLPQMQFMYFVNSHLLPCWRYPVSDRKMFESALPRGRTINEEWWHVATRGEFWSVPF